MVGSGVVLGTWGGILGVGMPVGLWGGEGCMCRGICVCACEARG